MARVIRSSCFNPRTRVGCDPLFGGIFLRQFGVSIHAPAWGATVTTSAGLLSVPGFNPRTRVGCDASSSANFLQGIEFQSTHPRGVRHDTVFGYQNRYDVSIHAPAWGATPSSEGLFCAICFNPRTRVGCDTDGSNVTEERCLFQSTHPRGVRRITGVTRGEQRSFNPRTRVGCDPTWSTQTVPRSPFQSTHPRGVRHVPLIPTLRQKLGFNPRTRVGCDRCLVVQRGRIDGFQSTHPRGVRPLRQPQFRLFQLSFNPRTRVGCDSAPSMSSVCVKRVSIHAPAWGATAAA